jgi:hypothetical protein
VKWILSANYLTDKGLIIIMNKKTVILLALAVLILFALVQFLFCTCLSFRPMCTEGYELSTEYYKTNWFCFTECSRASCVPVG